MIVTRADQTHVEQVAACIYAMHQESQYKHLPYNAQKVKHLIEVVISNSSSALFVGLDLAQTVQGFIALETSTYYFNDQCFTTDLGFYVRPSMRMTTIPIRLLQAAESWSKEQGNALVLGITAPEDCTKIAAMYSKLGFSQWGTVMRKEF